MTNRLVSIILFLLAATAANTANALGSGTKAVGDITLSNGSRLEAVSLELPCERDTQVKVVIDGKKEKLEADSIQSMVIWKAKCPEQKHLFVPFYAEFVDLETGEVTGIASRLIWCCLDQAENHASYWKEIGRPGFKKCKLYFGYNSLCFNMSLTYILKSGSDHPCYVPDSEKNKKKWIRVYFADDPEVIRKLDAGEYQTGKLANKHTDLRRIIADYTPRK